MIIHTFATPLQSNRVKAALILALQWAAVVIGVVLKRKSFHEGILATYLTIRMDTDSRDRALENLEVESVKSSMLGQIIRRKEDVDLEMGRRRK